MPAPRHARHGQGRGASPILVGLCLSATLAACHASAPVPLDRPPPAGHPLSTGGPPSALGRAPLFPDARDFDGERAALRVRPNAAGSEHAGWYAAKARWASRTGYTGWALIRVARLDGPGSARAELQLAGGTRAGEALAVEVLADWQFWPGGTEVSTPGCYAYQVDGAGFTEVIVFRAEPDPGGAGSGRPGAVGGAARVPAALLACRPADAGRGRAYAYAAPHHAATVHCGQWAGGRAVSSP